MIDLHQYRLAQYSQDSLSDYYLKFFNYRLILDLDPRRDHDLDPSPGLGLYPN